MTIQRKCPYKGLEPYDEEDAAFFFGRKRWRDIIAKNLRASRLTLLYGASGVGKSSVLWAGVAPYLRGTSNNGHRKKDTPGFPVVLFSSWRDDPLAALRRQVDEELRGASAVSEAVPRTASEPHSFFSFLQQKTKHLAASAGTGRLLIILDQFEEYFLYHLDERGDEAFATELSEVVRSPDVRVNFLISVREESLAKLDRFKGEIPGLFHNYLRLEHLDWRGAHDAIVKPIEEYNRTLKSETEAIDIEPEIVNDVLDEIEAGGTADDVWDGDQGRGGIDLGSRVQRREIPREERHFEAPLLQLVMQRLWNLAIESGSHALRCETLRRLGGAKKIAAGHVDKVLGSFEENRKDFLAKAFHYLVTPVGHKVAYSADELARYAEVKPDVAEEVLEALSTGEQRILRVVNPVQHQRNAKRYEIFHDILAKSVLAWRRGYIEEQRVETEKRGLMAQRERALRQVEEERRQRSRSIKQGLPAQALFQQRFRQDERAALLGRQAFLFHVRDQVDKLDVPDQLDNLDEIDAALRETLAGPNFNNVLSGHEEAVSAVAFSPDGRMLASGSHDGTIRLCRLHRGNDMSTTTLRVPTGGVNSVAFSPNGTRLASGCRDSQVRLWNAKDLNAGPVVLRGHSADVHSVAFSPDGKRLASSSEDGSIRVWTLSEPDRSPEVLNGHRRAVRSVAFSPDGRLLASGGGDNTIRLWELGRLDAGHQIFSGHAGAVNGITFSRDGSVLASCSDDRTIRLWYPNQPEKAPHVLEGHKDRVNAISFSPDEKTLASGGEDQQVWLWPFNQPDDAPARLEGQYLGISAVAFSPDGGMLASGSWDNTVRIFDLRAPVALPNVLKGHEENVVAVAFSPDGQWLASAGWDCTVRLWNPQQPETAYRGPLTHPKRVWGVAFSPDGRKLATACEDGAVRLWDAEEPDAAPVERGDHDKGACAVAFSPDGRWLASASWDATVRIWDMQHEDVAPRILRGHEDSVTTAAFSPDGRTLASGSDDKTVRVWDLDRGDVAHVVPTGHEGRVWCVAYSPDGQLLASTSDDRTIRLWNPNRSDPKVTILKGHNHWVGSLAFSSDGYRLASGSYDKTVRIWDLSRVHLADRIKPIVLRGHDESVTCVAFSPEGKTLASGSYDNTVRLWIADTGVLADEVCKKVLRNLRNDDEEWRWFMGPDIPYERTCDNLPEPDDGDDR